MNKKMNVKLFFWENNLILSKDHNVSILYNGEIYNYSDDEILDLYDRYGTDCINNLNGHFAMYIHDKERNIVILARDHVGIQPLYYSLSNDELIVSPKIKPIRNLIKTAPNYKAVFDYLHYAVINHSRYTFYENIKQVEAGSLLVINLVNGTDKSFKYWQNRLEKSTDSYDVAVTKTKQLILNSLKMRLKKTGKIFSTLSGGIDSSSIVCGIRHLVKSKEINTVSIRFPNSKRDELEYIGAVMENKDVKANMIYPSTKDYVEQLDKILDIAEEPFLTSAGYIAYKIREGVKDKTKCLFEGDGGDELFLGYSFFYPMYLGKLLSSGRLLQFMKKKGSTKLSSIIPYFLPNNIVELGRRKKMKFINKKFYKKHINKTPYYQKYLSKDKSFEDNVCSIAEWKTTYYIPLKSKYSDYFKIRNRFALLDKNIVEYIFSLPVEYLLNSKRTKGLLKDAFKEMLPKKIFEREVKIGGCINETTMISKDEKFIEFANNIVYSDCFKNREYINYGVFYNRYVVCMQGKDDDFAYYLWRVLLLEVWFKKNEKYFVG